LRYVHLFSLGDLTKHASSGRGTSPQEEEPSRNVLINLDRLYSSCSSIPLDARMVWRTKNVMILRLKSINTLFSSFAHLYLTQRILGCLHPLSIISHLASPRLSQITPLLSGSTMLADLLQGSAQLDDTEPQHSRLEFEDAFDLCLGRGIRVEPHDKVVAGIGACSTACETFGGFGQAEYSPVGYAADDAAGGED
jgi:hypothetical protein